MSPPASLDQPEVHQSDPQTEGPSSQGVRPHRILVVDNSVQNVDLISRFLKLNGFEPVTAYGGEEALRHIEDQEPEIVLLDLAMPQVDGFEVIRRVRSRSSLDAMPIIVLTALNDMNIKLQALGMGADDFLTKPFNQAELSARIRTHLRMRSLQKELHLRVEELARTNEALVRAQDRLIQAEKLSAIIELAGAVNHELNQPLTVILGQAELLMHELDRESPAYRRLEKIAYNCRKMAHILSKMNEIKDYRTKEYAESTRIVDLQLNLPSL